MTIFSHIIPTVSRVAVVGDEAMHLTSILTCHDRPCPRSVTDT